MARIALNTLFDPHDFPVDLTLLHTLGAEPYLCTRSFLRYCAADPSVYGSLNHKDRDALMEIISRHSADRCRQKEPALEDRETVATKGKPHDGQ